MAAPPSMATAMFYCCERCNLFTPPQKSSAIITYIEGNSFRFSWKNKSVTWKPAYGTFRVSFNLYGGVGVLKEADLPLEHTCQPPKPAALEKEIADSKEEGRPEYIDAILQSIRDLDEERLIALCKKNLNLHEFRDSLGRSIFHLIAAECFNEAPATLFERQGKINLLMYLCTDHNPSTFKDAQGRTPLESAIADQNLRAIRAFTQVDKWFKLFTSEAQAVHAPPQKI